LPGFAIKNEKQKPTMKHANKKVRGGSNSPMTQLKQIWRTLPDEERERWRGVFMETAMSMKRSSWSKQMTVASLCHLSAEHPASMLAHQTAWRIAA
jgi:hypothetical protein